MLIPRLMTLPILQMEWKCYFFDSTTAKAECRECSKAWLWRQEEFDPSVLCLYFLLLQINVCFVLSSILTNKHSSFCVDIWLFVNPDAPRELLTLDRQRRWQKKLGTKNCAQKNNSKISIQKYIQMPPCLLVNSVFRFKVMLTHSFWLIVHWYKLEIINVWYCNLTSFIWEFTESIIFYI